MLHPHRVPVVSSHEQNPGGAFPVPLAARQSWASVGPAIHPVGVAQSSRDPRCLWALRGDTEAIEAGQIKEGCVQEVL